MHNLIKNAALGALLASGGTAVANATPVYGYAELTISNFTVSGFASADQIMSSLTLSDAANYPSYASASNAGGGAGTVSSNVMQATSGPGPFPGENSFSQALLPANATTPAGTRSDAASTGSLPSNAGMQLVSEGKLVQPGAFASTMSGSNLNINAVINASTAEKITFSFDGSASLAASVGAVNDSANATTNVVLTVRDVTNASSPFSLRIMDNNTGTSAGTTASPNALNLTSSSSSPSLPNTMSSGTSSYSYSTTLQAGHIYQISLGDASQVLLSSAAAAVTAVPEPASLALMGIGLAGFAAIRRRRVA